jgi:hypothetical protein
VGVSGYGPGFLTVINVYMLKNKQQKFKHLELTRKLTQAAEPETLTTRTGMFGRAAAHSRSD